MNKYFNITTPSLLEIILQGNSQSDEAMYYLLTDRLYNKLRVKYESMSDIRNEDMADILDDFFLYLRDGNGKTTRPYSALNTNPNRTPSTMTRGNSTKNTNENKSFVRTLYLLSCFTTSFSNPNLIFLMQQVYHNSTTFYILVAINPVLIRTNKNINQNQLLKYPNFLLVD